MTETKTWRLYQHKEGLTRYSDKSNVPVRYWVEDKKAWVQRYIDGDDNPALDRYIHILSPCNIFSDLDPKEDLSVEEFAKRFPPRLSAEAGLMPVAQFWKDYVPAR